MQPKFSGGKCRYILIKIIGSIRESCEDDNLLIARIDWCFLLFTNQSQQRLQLRIMLRSNIADQIRQKLKILCIAFQFVQPRLVIHISEADTHLLANREKVGILIIVIEVGGGGDISQVNCLIAATVSVDGLNCSID